jgi:hypothetical protein
MQFASTSTSNTYSPLDDFLFGLEGISAAKGAELMYQKFAFIFPEGRLKMLVLVQKQNTLLFYSSSFL